jgi:hypothetical protein
MNRITLILAVTAATLLSMGGFAGADLTQLDKKKENTLGPGQYFLTDAVVVASDAPSSCGTGFHMASLYEILDPTPLSYAGSNLLAYQPPAPADLGSGPPSQVHGWVHTGYTASSVITSTPGQANCNGYTDGSSNNSGTRVRLKSNWEFFQGGDIIYSVAPWWDTDSQLCSDLTTHVWCVQD